MTSTTKSFKFYSGMLLLSVTLLVVTILVAAVFGTADISISDFFNAMIDKLPGVDLDVEIPKGHEIIIFNLRLPRILLALFAGMGLAIAGTVFQGVFSNPMAEPYLLGVSSGAAFGATVAAIIDINLKFLSFSAVSLFAFLGAISVVLLIYKLAMQRGELPVTVLLLSGLAVNYFLSSLITLMMTFNQDKIESVYFWTLGSFKNANWEKVFVVGIIVVVGVTYIYLYNRELDLIMMGDEQAKSLGVDVDRLKKRLLLISSLIAAVIVAASGIIGFVGLIIPHGVRLITGPSHRRLMPVAAIAGGIFLIICDTIARTILMNKEISVGIITSLCGVPFFLWLLYSHRKAVS